MIFCSTHRSVPYLVIIRMSSSSVWWKQIKRPQSDIMWIEHVNWRSLLCPYPRRWGGPVEIRGENTVQEELIGNERQENVAYKINKARVTWAHRDWWDKYGVCTRSFAFMLWLLVPYTCESPTNERVFISDSFSFSCDSSLLLVALSSLNMNVFCLVLFYFVFFFLEVISWRSILF